MALLCIDVGEVRTDGTARVLRAPIHEIELELEAGRPAAAVRTRARARGRRPAGVRAARARRSAATRCAHRRTCRRRVHADDPDLAPTKCTPGDAFAAIIRACLAQIEGNAHGVLHRTTTRNGSTRCASACAGLRACLSLARTGMRPRASSRCASSCAGSRRRLGPARDSTCSRRRRCRHSRRRRARRQCGRRWSRHCAQLAAADRRPARRRSARTRPRSVALRRGSCGWSPRRPRRWPPRQHGQPRTTQALAARARRRPAAAQATPSRAARARDRPLRTRRRKRATRRGSPPRSCATPRNSSRRCSRRSGRAQLPPGADRAAGRAGRLERRGRGRAARRQNWPEPQSPAAAAFSGWAAARGAARSDALGRAPGTRSRARAPFWSRD